MHTAEDKDNEEIINWIDTVNEASKAGKAEVKRIQVLTEGRYKFLKKLIGYKQYNGNWKDLIEDVRPSIRRQYEKNNVSLIEDEKNAKLLANNLVNGYEWYCENYADLNLKNRNVNCHIKWAVFTRESLKFRKIAINKVIPGEFIVFNGDILVRYSKDSELSETLTGKIVEPFLIAFTDIKCWNNQITLKPLFFGKGDYGKSAEDGKYHS